MHCYNKKTVFDFFKVSSCDSCKYLLKDYYFNIGLNTINIYYLDYCKRSVSKDYFIDSKKMKLFLKDMILNSGDDLFLIMERFNIDYYMKDLEVLTVLWI